MCKCCQYAEPETDTAYDLRLRALPLHILREVAYGRMELDEAEKRAKHPAQCCRRCGGDGGEWLKEGPHTVWMPCYHCRERGMCACDECHRWGEDV